MHLEGRSFEAQQGSSVTYDQLIVRDILLATDFSGCSTRALDYAVGIATRYESQLHLFHSIDPRSYMLADRDVVWKTRDDLECELQSLVLELRRRGRAKDLAINIIVEVGDFSATFRQVVKDLDPSLIVVGTHGRTGWRKMVLGSVAETVIDQAPCPVLSVGPSTRRRRIQESGPEKILLVSEAYARSSLAESYAFSLARKYGSRLTAIDFLENESGRVIAQVSELECRESEFKVAIPDRELVSSSIMPTEIGAQSDLILQTANHSAADLIVVAVPETHRFTDRFLSTESYRVVCGAPCPVLTARAR